MRVSSRWSYTPERRRIRVGRSRTEYTMNERETGVTVENEGG